MNKYLLKIMELLDKEGLVDKELKFGCYVRIGDNEYGIVIFSEKEKNYNKDKNIYKYNTEVYLYEPKSVGNPYVNGRFATMYYWFQKNLENDGCEIIGQIHLWHILQWFYKKGFLQLSLSNGRIVSGVDFINLDLGKPPMERDEEQCKELYNFMIKCTQ